MSRRPALFFAGMLAATAAFGAEKTVAKMPSAFDSSEWTALLSRHVDANGLIDYGKWKADAADRKLLAAYLAKFNASPGQPSDAEKISMLINAYNAFIIETVLAHYPVDGIRSISGAFTRESHAIGGERYSLDEIEHTCIRLAGYRAHAAMVCASRSCPPLDRKAYGAGDLTEHLEERWRVWMSRGDLYQFEPESNLVRLPKYFDWYRADFEKVGIANVLARFAPQQYRAWLAAGKFRTEFLEYDWSLNDRFPTKK